MKEYISRLFSKIPIVKNAKNEDGECVEFAKRLQRMTRQGELDAVWFHVANEFAGKERPQFGSKLKAMGKLAGVSDYIFMWGANCGCLEFKYGKNKQQQNQKDFESWCVDNNVKYSIAYTWQEGFEILKSWGIIKNDFQYEMFEMRKYNKS